MLPLFAMASLGLAAAGDSMAQRPEPSGGAVKLLFLLKPVSEIGVTLVVVWTLSREKLKWLLHVMTPWENRNAGTGTDAYELTRESVRIHWPSEDMKGLFDLQVRAQSKGAAGKPLMDELLGTLELLDLLGELQGSGVGGCDRVDVEVSSPGKIRLTLTQTDLERVFSTDIHIDLVRHLDSWYR